MKRKIFGLTVVAVLLAFGAFAMIDKVAAVNIPPVVINEVNPVGGWVELLNTTGQDVSLSDWYLSEYTNPAADDRTENLKQLTGTIPPKGLFVVPIGNLDAGGDKVSLYHGDPNDSKHWQTESDDSSVVYGISTDDQPGPFGYADIGLPSAEQSIVHNPDLSGWSLGASTKGWFNDAGNSGSAPKLADLTNSLAATNVTTNLATLDDPTHATSLYFDKVGVGRIEFSKEINLTDPATVSTLTNLVTNLKIENRVIEFNPDDASGLKTLGAILTMRGLDADYATSSLRVTDGDVLYNTNEAVSSFSQDPTTRDVTINANHFTRFELQSNDGGNGGDGSSSDVVPPTVTFTAPALVSGSLTLSATATDTDSGVARVLFYYAVAGNDPVLIGQETATSAPDTYSLDWNTTKVADGTYDVTAVAYDGSGNSATSSAVSMQITNEVLGGGDTIAPSGTITAPALGGAYATTSTLLEVTASDNDGGSGLAKAQFYADVPGADILLGESTNEVSPGVYQVYWTPSLSTVANGDYNIYAKIYDQAGNSATTTEVFVRVDTTLPVVTFTYNPSSSTTNNVTATLHSDKPVTVLNNGGQATYTFTDNGDFEYHIVDAAGHEGYATATVQFIDRTPPAISAISPAPGSKVNGFTHLSFSDSEFTMPKCSVDGLNWNQCATIPSLGAISGWNFIDEGLFTLYLRDVDAAGNEGSSTVIYIKDTLPPVLVGATATDPMTIKVQFNEDLQAEWLSTEDFGVTVNGVDDPISQVAEDNGLVTITLTNPISGTNPAISLSIKQIQQQSIRDTAYGALGKGNKLTKAMTVPVDDGIAPIIVDASTANDSAAVLTISEDLQSSGTSTPNLADFQVYLIRNRARVDVPVTAIQYANKQITLTLGSTLYYGDVVYYTIRAGSSLVDLAGNRFNQGLEYTGTITNTLKAPSGGSGGGSFYLPTETNPREGRVLGISTYRFTKNLSYCMQHTDVGELQLRLTQEGYYAGPITNYFGVNTLKAVKAYQKTHGIPTTGYVGPMTRGVLNNDLMNLNTRNAKISGIMEQLLNIQILLDELKKGTTTH